MGQGWEKRENTVWLPRLIVGEEGHFYSQPLHRETEFVKTDKVISGSTSIVGVEKKQIISSSVGRIPGTAFMRGKTGCVF